MAKLNFKYATMNSGKSLDLMRTAYNYEENGYKILVIKPLIDTKGEDYIVSRVGLKRHVDILLSKEQNVYNIVLNDYDDIKCILVDEAQFLTAKQVDELFLVSKKLDIDVICYGLRLNFKMEAFEGSKRLLEISEELEELKTMCQCGNIARYVGRKVNGEYVTDGDEVVIDGTANIEYIPLCGECYLKDVMTIDLEKPKVKKLER